MLFTYDSVVHVPAEVWEEYRKCYSLMSLAECRKPPAPVKVFWHGGAQYTGLGGVSGPWGYSSKDEMHAARLVPEDWYEGPTTLVYHDEDAIQRGLRARGDHKGLVVSVRGRRMVIARSVGFVKELPSTVPLSANEVRDYTKNHEGEGWPSQGALRGDWVCLEGHPVLVEKDGRPFGTLYYLAGGRLHEMRIRLDDVVLDTTSEVAVA